MGLFSEAGGEPADSAGVSVFLLQAPSVSTANNATAAMDTDLMLDARMSIPF
jgi:hypothetical protein